MIIQLLYQSIFSHYLNLSRRVKVKNNTDKKTPPLLTVLSLLTVYPTDFDLSKRYSYGQYSRRTFEVVHLINSNVKY